MANAFTLFQSLLPKEPLMIGTVYSSSGDTHMVNLLGGGRLIARGKAEVGKSVFVKGGVIQGDAPALPTVTIDI